MCCFFVFYLIAHKYNASATVPQTAFADHVFLTLYLIQQKSSISYTCIE